MLNFTTRTRPVKMCLGGHGATDPNGERGDLSSLWVSPGIRASGLGQPKCGSPTAAA